MIIRSLAVNQFKRFTTPKRLDCIKDGLNVVVGPNEMGKSTLLDALRAVLFEKYNSKARSITSLQNDRNQAAPVVQLDFELDDGVYCITKRFVKKPYARLSCPDGRILEGDTAENTLRDLLAFHEPGKTGAKPETLGMWNVLWVQQGQSFGALDLPNSAQSNLHIALESEVGNVLGGRRGRALPKTLADQLGELVTPATGRPRGEYKELIDRDKDIKEELESLSVRRQDLTQTLNDLEDAQDALNRLSLAERDEADEKELRAARQRQRKLAEFEARVAAAGTELKLGIRNLDQAKQATVSRQQLKDDIESEKHSLNEADNRLKEMRKQEKKAWSQLQDLVTEMRKSEAAVTNADEAVTRLRRLVTAVERRARVDEFQRRHHKAEAAEERRREAQQDAAAILVTDEAIGAIRNAAKKCENTRNRLSAAATLISFEMTPEGLSGLDVDGKPLTTDQPSLQIVEPATITIPERGKITIEPAIDDRDKLLRQSRDSENKLRELLERVGANTVSEAEDQHAKRQKLVQDEELARQEVELHAPATDEYGAGAQALFDYIEGLRRVLKREMCDLELRKLPTHLEAEDGLRAAEEQADEARSTLAATRAALGGPENALKTLQTELGTLQGRNDESKDRLEKLQKQLAQEVEERSDDELDEAIEEARAALLEQETVVSGLEAQRTDETLPQLDARISRLERVVKDKRDKRSRIRETIAGLKSRVVSDEGIGLDEMIEQKCREMELCDVARQRLEREVKVLSLLLSTLRQAERSAKERYLSPVLKRVRPYLRLLFPRADIQIDENLHITGVVRETGHEEPFDHLSMGTQEQIAVLVRLAFAEMLVEQSRPAAVVLDDALVFSDDSRMSRMFDILNMAAHNVQVIIFTCREQLFEELGGNPLSLAAANTEELVSA